MCVAIFFKLCEDYGISLIYFKDIGANLTDDMYQGIYHGSKKHEPDLHKVLERSWSGGLKKIIITGGSLAESKKALELACTDCKYYVFSY